MIPTMGAFTIGLTLVTATEAIHVAEKPPTRQLIWCDPVNIFESLGWFLYLFFEDRISSSRGR